MVPKSPPPPPKGDKLTPCSVRPQRARGVCLAQVGEAKEFARKLRNERIIRSPAALLGASRARDTRGTCAGRAAFIYHEPRRKGRDLAAGRLMAQEARARRWWWLLLLFMVRTVGFVASRKQETREGAKLAPSQFGHSSSWRPEIRARLCARAGGLSSAVCTLRQS